MSSQKFRETIAGSSKLLLLISRPLFLAPFVSFVTSFWAMLPGTILIALFGQHVGRAMCFTFVGFCGVFSGACCVPRRSRAWAALGLTALGMIYYSNFLAEWGNVMTDEGKLVNEYDRSLLQLIQLGIGGLLATTLIGGISSAAFQRFRQKHYGPDIPCPPVGPSP